MFAGLATPTTSCAAATRRISSATWSARSRRSGYCGRRMAAATAPPATNDAQINGFRQWRAGPGRRSENSGMRILMVSDFYPPYLGGVEVLVATMSRELVLRGHEVAVVTLAAP